MLAVLATLLVTLGVTAPPAQALTARSISAKATPATAYTSTAVAFTGRVTKSPTGTLVRIQRRASGAWVNVASTRTVNSLGAYKASVPLPAAGGLYYFRAVSPATSKLAATGSPVVAVTALRRTAATLTASPASIQTGNGSTLSGTVTPYVAGTALTVQRLVGSTWTTFASTTVQANGTFTRSVSPTVTTSYRVVVPRAGYNASTVSPARTVTVTQAQPSPPTITTTSVPVAGRNRLYSATLAKTGGDGTWTKTAGTLPTGISLSSAGVLSGTPTVLGSSTFTVTFTVTSTGLSASKQLSLTVAQAPTVTTSSLPDAARFQAYSTTLAKTGGAGTWNVTGLPAGLSANPSTGEISGTPTGPAGTYGVYPTFTETATGLASTKALALTVTGSNAAITTTSLPDAVRNQAYSATLTHTGGPGTWAVTGLPAGLTYDTSTGAISGTTSVSANTYNLQVTFTETSTGIQTGKQIPLHVVGGNVVVTTSALPDATRAEPYSVTLTHSGGPGTWQVQGLPAPLTYDAGTGVISGVPKTVQQYAIAVTFTETASGVQASKLLGLTVGGLPLRITNTELPDATRGVAYSTTLTTTGKAGTWDVAGLPAGLSVNPTTGEISGTTAAVAGTYAVYATFTETITGDDTTKAFALVLEPNPVITTGSLPDATSGSAYSHQLTKTGGAGTWEITKGALPEGVTLSDSGLISGTPTLGDDYGFTVTFTETASDLTDDKALLLHVSNPGAPVITTASLPTAVVGTAYSSTLSATPDGGMWTVSFGSLPAGLSLDPVTGAITGTPTTAGKSLFQVTYTLGVAYQTKVFELTTFPAS